MFNFEKLEVYKEAKVFSKLVFNTLKHLNIDREITNQIKRAVISIVLNIAEGSTRGTKKQFNQFLWVSQGSISEVIAGFDLIRMLYPSQKFNYQEIYNFAEILAKKINKLIH